MNDLIDEYAPNLKAKLESNPAYLRAATAPDGNIYVLGTDYNEYSQNFLNRTFIETSFLENLGMTMPTTLEELYDYLVAVKEKDANGNGDPDDEIPMVSLETGNDGSMFRSLIMTYFTKAGVWDNRIATDGKVEFLGATDGYRKGLEFLHKLYEEGLIYKEVFALSSNQDIWKLNEHDENVNTVGLVIGQHQRVPTNTDTTRHYSYDYLPALEGGTVAQVVQGAIQVNTCIPATCSDPAAAMRIIDYIATEEGSVLARMGVEGKDWVKAEEGYKTPSGEQAYWRYTTTEEREAMNPDGTYVFGSLGNGWPMYVPDYYWEEAINEGTTAKDVWGWYHNAYVTGFYGDALLPDENFMPSVLYYGPDMIEEISVDGRKRTYQITLKGIDAYFAELSRLKQCITDAEGEIQDEKDPQACPLRPLRCGAN